MLIVMLLAFLIAPRGGPDPDEPLASAIERIVAEREDGWVLERRAGRTASMVQLWRPREAIGGPTPTPTPVGGRPPFVEISTFLLASDGEAREHLAQSVYYTPVSPVGSVESLGNESFVFWNGNREKEFTSIRFRKANVMIFVQTSSRKVAERFAFDALAAIEDRLNVSTRGLIVK